MVSTKLNLSQSCTAHFFLGLDSLNYFKKKKGKAVLKGVDDKPGGEETSSLQSLLYSVTAIPMMGTKFKPNPVFFLLDSVSFKHIKYSFTK